MPLSLAESKSFPKALNVGLKKIEEPPTSITSSCEMPQLENLASHESQIRVYQRPLFINRYPKCPTEHKQFVIHP